MKLYANQLPTELSKGIKPCYLLFGDEPFQIAESRDLIKRAAKSKGVEEVIRLVEDDQFDWEDLRQHCQALSLFASTKLIELELTSNKVLKAGAEVLKEISTELSQDTILVLFGPKLDASQTKTAWFKALSGVGDYIPVYEIEGPHLKRWLQNQLSQRQLTMSADAQAFLLSYTAGNLLACSQELDKLKMALPDSPTLSLSAIEQYIANQARYTVFQLMEAVLKGDANLALTIISRLKLEEFEPNILLWSIQKDALIIKALQDILLVPGRNTDPKPVFDQHRVWKNKQAIYLAAVNRLSPNLVNQVIKELAQFDVSLKQFQLPCPYTLASHLCLKLCGVDTLSGYEWPVVNELVS
ncbi:DNA polymerase III subunit delta [Psychrosphaera ytuae]|uniref:DNA polymerase III subunit delta n=1 Tax=Psychrosphaera ytuae TaxID=2820710 RepID=A0A975DEZ3_9GAMM|nr:DNA polymerase III subunit delta [Psychrosphaera ytuae]QTH64405.1 DNA polymerase III subunit delta [Psychrosphaera ytuae]